MKPLSYIMKFFKYTLKGIALIFASFLLIGVVVAILWDCDCIECDYEGWREKRLMRRGIQTK